MISLFRLTGSRKRSEVPHLPSDPPSAADEVHVWPADWPKHQNQRQVMNKNPFPLFLWKLKFQLNFIERFWKSLSSAKWHLKLKVFLSTWWMNKVNKFTFCKIVVIEKNTFQSILTHQSNFNFESVHDTDLSTEDTPQTPSRLSLLVFLPPPHQYRQRLHVPA